MSLIACGILLFYDGLFLQQPDRCLWPNGWCEKQIINVTFLGIPMKISTEVHYFKFMMIKIQIGLATVMIFDVFFFIGIYVYSCLEATKKSKLINATLPSPSNNVAEPPKPICPTVAYPSHLC